MKLKTAYYKRNKSARNRSKPVIKYSTFDKLFYSVGASKSKTYVTLKRCMDDTVTFCFPSTQRIEVVQRDLSSSTFSYKVAWSFASVDYSLYTNNIPLVFELLQNPNIEWKPHPRYVVYYA